MRYVLELPDLQTFKLAATVLQLAQNLEADLGPVKAQNIVLGMQYQLGVIASDVLQISEGGDIQTDILDDLHNLIGTAWVFVKALTPQPEIDLGTTD